VLRLVLLSCGSGSCFSGDVTHTVLDTGREELPSILIYGDRFTNSGSASQLWWDALPEFGVLLWDECYSYI